MHPMRLDDTTADRMAAGLVPPDDAPPGYAGVAELLDAARQATARQDPARQAAVVAAVSATMAAVGESPHTPWRKRMSTTRLSARTAAVASALVLAGATAAAAATGSLPGPAQDTAASVLSHVGISVPNNAGQGTGDQQTTDSGTNSSTGPNANALFGLCTAVAAHAKHGVQPHSTVFPSASTCTTVTQPSGTADGTNGSTSDSGTAPSGTSQPSGTPVGPPSSVPVGPPTSTPPSSTPVGPPVTPPSHPGSGGRP